MRRTLQDVSVVRSWLRALLSASGITLLVPVGLVAAVAVAATVGGSGLGSVGQLLGGPEVPNGDARAAARDDLPTVPARRTRGRDRDRARAAAPARRTATRAPARRRPSGGSAPAPTTPPQTTRPTQQTTAQTPAPAPTPTATQTTPAPTPTTPAETNPVRQVGAAVQDVVKPLPIVGPVAADAVGTVIDLVAPRG